MWPSSLSNLYDHANELANKASGMADVAKEASGRLQSRLSEAASATPQEVLSRMGSLASSAAENAAAGSIVLARQTKLKGEIALLESSAKAWKQEWGLESFDAYFAGDLQAVTLSLYRCKAEMDSIHATIRVKKSQIEGLSEFGQSYDDVLHGGLRRWHVRISAKRTVGVRHETAISGCTGQLPLRCAMRTWRRLLVQRASKPAVCGSSPEGDRSDPAWLVPD